MRGRAARARPARHRALDDIRESDRGAAVLPRGRLPAPRAHRRRRLMPAAPGSPRPDLVHRVAAMEGTSGHRARSRRTPASTWSRWRRACCGCQLPIDMPGLGHVNCYLLEDERGVAMVDPGLPGEDTCRVLVARLRTAGVPCARVHTVVVTHSHPDHFGGAAACARSRAPTSSPTVASRCSGTVSTRATSTPRSGRRRRDRRGTAARRAQQPVRSTAVGRRADEDAAAPAGVVRARPGRAPIRRHPPAHRARRGRPDPDARPTASGSPCTRPATPRTTSACSTRPRA